MKTLKEINERMAQIAEEIRKEDADVDALTKEVDELEEEKRTLIKNAEMRKATLDKIANSNVGTVIERKEEEKMDERKYDAKSAEYRSAYFKKLLDKDLNEEERAAFTQTTANTPDTLPTTTLDKIWDLVSKKHSIMEDITVYRTGTILDIVRHTEITKGKAKNVKENAANDDEENKFVKVTLSGKDFSKSVELSYAAANMSIDALEDYLVKEISDNLGEALAEDVIATIDEQINAANKVETASTTEVTYKELATLFGKLKRVSNVKVYVSNATLYNQLVAMTDSTGRPIFQPNANDGAKGVLLGGEVKVEDAVAEGTILVGDPQRVVYNMVNDILIETDKDIKNHKYIYSGYARGEGALIDDMSFAKLSLKVGA